MGETKPEPKCWEVRKLSKVVAEYEKEETALSDAASRNDAASLLNVKATYVAVQRQA